MLKSKFCSFPIQSGRFTSPRSTLHKPYVFSTTLQSCYVFYTTFQLSPFSLVLKRCTKYVQYVQCYTFSWVYCNVVRIALRVCNVVYFQCILRNVLRQGRRGRMKRLYKIHSKIAILTWCQTWGRSFVYLFFLWNFWMEQGSFI